MVIKWNQRRGSWMIDWFSNWLCDNTCSLLYWYNYLLKRESGALKAKLHQQLKMNTMFSFQYWLVIPQLAKGQENKKKDCLNRMMKSLRLVLNCNNLPNRFANHLRNTILQTTPADIITWTGNTLRCIFFNANLIVLLLVKSTRKVFFSSSLSAWLQMWHLTNKLHLDNLQLSILLTVADWRVNNKLWVNIL